MSATILISGASGLIGTRLTEILLGKGYRVRHLVRKKASTSLAVEHFIWDPGQGTIDEKAMEGTDYIINLSGANVSEGRWTEARKKEIIDSRVLSTRLLVNTALKHGHSVKKMINASATGYYGFGDQDTEFPETAPAGHDFLARVCKLWEDEMVPLEGTRITPVVIRIGIVLSARGGALQVMAKTVKLYAGAPLGSGKQMVSWIHEDDLLGIFTRAVEDPGMKGPYNAAAPQPVTNATLTKAIGRALHKPVWPLPVPGFMLKILLGEQAEIVLEGYKASSQKIMGTGFQFQHPEIGEAVTHLLKPGK